METRARLLPLCTDWGLLTVFAMAGTGAVTALGGVPGMGHQLLLSFEAYPPIVRQRLRLALAADEQRLRGFPQRALRWCPRDTSVDICAIY